MRALFLKALPSFRRLNQYKKVDNQEIPLARRERFLRAKKAKESNLAFLSLGSKKSQPHC